jgi:hypothetical protein
LCVVLVPCTSRNDLRTRSPKKEKREKQSFQNDPYHCNGPGPILATGILPQVHANIKMQGDGGDRQKRQNNLHSNDHAADGFSA